ncbi:MAG: hypothetical protein JJT77_12515 [Crocinitomicaceae bacterium]|nr:hypothetical protein [Crocinitomicaceae bacterium]
MNIPITITTQRVLQVYQDQELPLAWVNDLQNAHLFKMFVPKELGGLQLDLCEAMIYLQSTANLFPSLGWVHNLVAGANYFCGFFNEETAQALFNQPGVMTAGSGATAGLAIKQENGWLVTGDWSMCSGSKWATHFTGITTNEKGELLTFITDKESVQLEKSWPSAGLKMTASDTFHLNNKFIPDHQIFTIGINKSYSDYKLYQMPFDFFARLCLSATFQGIVEGWLAVLKNENLSSIRTQALERQIIEKTSYLAKTRESLIASWKKHHQARTMQGFNVSYVDELGNMHKAIYMDVMQLYFQTGIRASYADGATFQWLVDLQTAVQHFMLKPSHN